MIWQFIFEITNGRNRNYPSILFFFITLTFCRFFCTKGSDEPLTPATFARWCLRRFKHASFHFLRFPSVAESLPIVPFPAPFCYIFSVILALKLYKRNKLILALPAANNIWSFFHWDQIFLYFEIRLKYHSSSSNTTGTHYEC